MKVGEDGERRGEAHPAVEIASVAPIAEREADESDQPEAREQRRGEAHVRALDDARRRAAPRVMETFIAPAATDEHHDDADSHRERASDGAPPSARPRRARSRSGQLREGAHRPAATPRSGRASLRRSTGTRPNATVPSAMLQKPAASRRSSVRPSTRNRTLVSTQTNVGDDCHGGVERRAVRPGARTTDFSESLAAKSAVPDASRQTSRISPRSQDR